MKQLKNKSLLFVLALTTAFTTLGTQEVSAQEIGADVVSRYVWRGTQFGSGVHVQPYMSYTTGNLEVGAWGSFGLANDGGSELDIYASYDLGFASLTVTNYTFPSDVTGPVNDDFFGTEGYEVSAGFDLGPVGMTVGYFTESEDLYVEAGFALGSVDVAVGAGDNVYTTDGDFALVNISLGTSKDIKITEDYSLPAFGSFVYNPDQETAFLVFGLSF